MLLGRKPSITPEQAAAGLANGELVLVDVRQTFEMERGRIHGAINIPLGTASRQLAAARPGPHGFDDFLSALADKARALTAT
jgi:rhodanese-related sulfurtransferase